MDGPRSSRFPGQFAGTRRASSTGMLRRLAALSIAIAGTAALAAGCSSSPEQVDQSDDAVDYICNEKVSASIDGIPAYAYCGNTDVWSDNGVDTKKVSG